MFLLILSAVPATNPVQELFTPQAVGTFVGASGAVVVLTNVFIKLLGRVPPPWVAFGFSLCIAMAGAYAMEKLHNLMDVLIAFLNAGLLFTSASGLHETLAQIPVKPAPPPPPTPTRPRLFPSWFK